MPPSPEPEPGSLYGVIDGQLRPLGSLTHEEATRLQKGHELRQAADAAAKLAERLEMLGPTWARRYREVRALEGLIRGEYRYQEESTG